jgi:hypothetical protein
MDGEKECGGTEGGAGVAQNGEFEHHAADGTGLQNYPIFVSPYLCGGFLNRRAKRKNPEVMLEPILLSQ